MIHNRYGFKIGDICIVDAEHPNWNKVKIIRFTPNEMFATIHLVCEDESKTWDTMTNRLSPIKY